MEYPNIISAVPEGEHFDASAVNEGVWLSQAHLDSLENRLQENAGSISSAAAAVESGNAAIEAANTTIADRDATIAAKDEEIATLTAENAKLKAGPAGSFSNTSKEQDDLGADGFAGLDPVNTEAAKLRKMRNKN